MNVGFNNNVVVVVVEVHQILFMQYE